MPVNTKAIKRRMKSVGNTKKITKAMEMVSAAKMRRAIEATINTRTYAQIGRETLRLLSKADHQNFPLLHVQPVERLLVILVSSNRGLCGSYNANIFKKTKLLLRQPEALAAPFPPDAVETGEGALSSIQTPAVHIIGIGKKSAEFAKRHGYPLVAVFDELGDRPHFTDILPVSKLVLNAYAENQYQQVVVAYTDYKSSLTQEPRMIQLLPVHAHDIEGLLERLGGNNTTQEQQDDDIVLDQYLFEPGLEEILTTMLPRLVEIQLFQTILESVASEHSARMLAMRNASDAAGEMIDELTLTLNKARQATITQEIAEIVGGAAALG